MKFNSLIVAFFFCIIPILMPSLCYGESLPEEFFSKNYLGKINWKNKNLPSQIFKNWPIFTGDQSGKKGFDNKKIIKNGALNIDGFSYNGSLRRYNKSGNYEITFVINSSQNLMATPQNLDYCNRLIKKYSTSFGPPSNLVNLSTYPSEKTGGNDQKAYWNINNSRIYISCFAIQIYSFFTPLIIIQYGFKDDVAKVHNVVFLKCTETYKGTGILDDGKITEEPPFTLTINPNVKNITSKKKKMGKTTTYNEREIVSQFEDKKKNIKSIFSLDRYSGSYEWVIESTDKKLKRGYGRKYWGDCKKIKREKKF